MNKSQEQKHTNRLINETSPYLLQHAHNPVDWYPWGKAAFDKAKAEDKLVLVSIGYAACHWCHVMEHESFEDEEVAKIMNEHFVCIKVDREERPDVDHTYMDAVQIMTGRGGWPLNCFALPDGRPVFGGTYFQKEQWVSVLTQLKDVYRNDKPRVVASADEIMKGIKQYNLVEVTNSESEFTKEKVKEIVENWKPRFDAREGGNRGAPKFPMPNNFLFQLKYFYYAGDDDVLRHLELSLDKMAYGGIYDHVGGGFARYSTDALWKVPHFEKMLYDNAQLVSVYAQAYKLFQKETYKQVVFKTLEFVDRELTSAEGTFYSSIDADSEGKEGTFYIWNYEELKSALKDDFPVFESYYGISTQGNWEYGNNVLHQHKTAVEVADEKDISFAEVNNSLRRSRDILFQLRENRERPITDDKILTAWNALMITAYVDAYKSFGEDSFLKNALRAANYFRTNCVSEEGAVLRMVRENSDIPGFLDDYALLAQAFIGLYQVTFDEDWLELSLLISDYSIQHFYDVNTGLFFYSSLDEGSTITNKTEISDNVIPASNSVMAHVLYQLSFYFDRTDFEQKALKMLNNVSGQLEKNGAYYSNWAGLMCDVAYQTPEVVFTGSEAEQLRKEWDQSFLYGLTAGSSVPGNLPLLKDRVVEGQSLIYICRDKVCKLPVENVEEAIKQL